jgi:CRP/FNR family cyclic AMP-dependent transcriptional regulator
MKISDAKIWLTKKVLRENELFQDLDDTILDALIAQADVKLLSEGNVLYHKGDSADDTFCIIIFGSVKIVGDNGQVLAVQKRGKVMGEIGVMGMQHKRSADVIALEPTSILEWRFSDVKDKSPELIKRLQNLAFMHLRSTRK